MHLSNAVVEHGCMTKHYHRFDIHLSSETIEYASISDVQVKSKTDPEEFRGMRYLQCVNYEYKFTVKPTTHKWHNQTHDNMNLTYAFHGFKLPLKPPGGFVFKFLHRDI